ncbi:MAG: WYL domain-containing protein [Polyangiaceae bacterium]|nr:WYL domain-containing protein [Polyangiaceae bacterium]
MPRPGPEAETVHRLWTLLRLIPRRPRRADTGTLKRQLDAEGIDVTPRSIQRDLQHLAARFQNLHCDERSKPYGWSWDGDVPMLEIPGMELSAAVTFELVQAHLAQALPRSTLKTLDPYFGRAREVIRNTTSAKLARWPSKVRVLPRGISLRAPEVPPRVLDVVYNALLEDRCLRALYRPRHAPNAKKYELNPLGLVVRDGTLALVCTFWEYDDPHYVLLHRMSQAELLETAARRPTGFDLDAFLARGGVGFVHGDPIALEALVAREVAITLHETPLSTDQSLAPAGEEHELLRATVPNTLDLRGWLQSYGPLLEVRKPVALRKELAESARQLAAMYGKRGGKSK